MGLSARPLMGRTRIHAGDRVARIGRALSAAGLDRAPRARPSCGRPRPRELLKDTVRTEEVLVQVGARHDRNELLLHHRRRRPCRKPPASALRTWNRHMAAEHTVFKPRHAAVVEQALHEQDGTEDLQQEHVAVVPQDRERTEAMAG